MEGGLCQGPLCTLPVSLFTSPNFQCVPSKGRLIHKLKVVFSAFVDLSSSKETEPLALFLLDFLVLWYLLLPCFQGSLLLSPTNPSGYSTVTHSPVPSAQWTCNMYSWSEYPSLKYKCFHLAFFSFFTNMIFNNHIHTHSSNYSLFVAISQALALGPNAFQYQTHILSLLVYLSKWLYSDTSKPASPESVSIHSTDPDTSFLALLLSSMPRISPPSIPTWDLIKERTLYSVKECKN